MAEHWQNRGSAPEMLQARVRAELGITEPLKPLNVEDFEKGDLSGEQEFYVLIDGKPVLKSRAELEILLKSLGGDTLICPKGGASWTPAKDVFADTMFALQQEQAKAQEEQDETTLLLETYPTSELVAMALAAQVITADPGDGVDRADLIQRIKQSGIDLK